MSVSTARVARDESVIARLSEDFDYYDRDCDGLMEYAEFILFMDAIDAGLSEDECRSGFRAIDADLDGVIEFDEFLEWWGLPG